MSSFSRSIQRYLDDNNAKINILKDEQFKVSREVLKSKRRELRKQGKGGRPNATEALSNEDIELIFNENQFGIHDPDVLSRTMWFLLTLHFGHRARHEARQMKFGDIILRKDEASGRSSWSGKLKERARPATAMKMNTEGVSNQKRTKLAIENVQSHASKNLFPDGQKKPNHQKVLSSWLFDTEENQMIQFGF